MVTVDEFGDQGADLLEHAEHRRPDAELGGAPGRLGLVGAIDAEQRGAFAGDAHDVLTMVGRHHEVSIRDAAAQWTNLHGLAGEQTALAHEPFHACPLVHTSTV